MEEEQEQPFQRKSPPAEGDYWAYLDHLLTNRKIIIDRPAGSQHPRFSERIYPLDYGYLDNTHSADKGGIDLFRGSLADPELDAMICTIDFLKGDSEIKLLLGCTEGEKSAALSFLSDGEGMRALLIRRGGFSSWLRSRRSVRRFASLPIPQHLLEEVLQTATWAPSAHNRQPWRFVVIETQATRLQLIEKMGADFRRDLAADGLPSQEIEAQVERSRQRILEAPAVILLCLDRSVGDRYPDQRRQEAEQLMGVQGVAMAGENLLLAAHAVGLAGVWVCAPLFAQQTVRQALELPGDWLPQGMILLGYPAYIPPPRPRRPIEEVTRFL